MAKKDDELENVLVAQKSLNFSKPFLKFYKAKVFFSAAGGNQRLRVTNNLPRTGIKVQGVSRRQNKQLMTSLVTLTEAISRLPKYR
ncbi:unnamed protein product [Cylicocyclus nassatus]|uniref:Uncharacterized protein n=1 Tax=Cylicocyclus nassatus TaxID=53992 RepID=A0AA36DNL4_CYLNA|nr:unnamed protein product [Cylicocyclus nassatus]